jgi:hypothetical protein
MLGQCKLCLKNNVELQMSHIIPKFVWKWLRDSGPSNLRSHREPNKRIQDGPKFYLLCSECEQRFSDWEKPFSEKIFLPLHDPEPVTNPIYYEDWALKFAVSVSWRTLMYFKQQPSLNHLTDKEQLLTTSALETWRKFMLGQTNNLKTFNQHLLPVDVISNYDEGKVSPFLNRYMLRNVHIDVIASKSSVYVYSKLCRVILFGRIYEKHPNEWQGMQLKPNKGDIHPRDYHLPGEVAEYMNRKADAVKQALESMSPRQQEIADESFKRNIDVIANSEIFRAMQFDVLHSGKDAFSPGKKTDDD